MLFIDFDGVIVDSNNFKEIAIEKSIYKTLGKSDKTIAAINFFNINAGISRKINLRNFSNHQISQIMKLYAQECKKFFNNSVPTAGFIKFLKILNFRYGNLKIFILSGGEKDEIELFLKKHNLLKFFDDILASEKSKLNHLLEKQVTKNDIFIGDSQNDLDASVKCGIKFILFSEYRSLNSFPKSAFIKDNVFLETNNFESLIKMFSDE